MKKILLISILVFVIGLFKGNSQTCPYNAMANDIELSGQGDDLLEFFDSYPDYGIRAYILLVEHPVVRLEVLEGLFNLTKIIDGSLPKVVTAGFAENMLNTLFEFLRTNGSLYNDINPGGGNGLQKLIDFIEGLESMSNSSSLARVRSGLETTGVGKMRGEMFRIRRWIEKGLGVDGIEVPIASPGGIWTNNANFRWADIVEGNVKIECKFWAEITTWPLEVSTQIAKDLHLIFNRIEVDGIPHAQAFAEFLWEFKKSSGVDTPAVMKAQLKQVWTTAANQSISSTTANLTVQQVKDIINAKFAANPSWGHANLDAFIDNSGMFNLID